MHPRSSCATTTAVSATGFILVIDLGKYKSVAGTYDRATAQARFDMITTSRRRLRKRFDR